MEEDDGSWHSLALQLVKRGDFWGDSLASLGHVAVGSASLGWEGLTQLNGPSAMFTAELPQVPLMGQVVAVGLLGLANKRLMGSKLGKLVLLYNVFGLYLHARRMKTALVATKAFQASLDKAGIKYPSGWSTSAMLALLVPLRSFLTKKELQKARRASVSYASLESVDPGLFERNKSTSKTLKRLQTYAGRGRVAQWLTMDVMHDPRTVQNKKPVLMYIHGGGFAVGDKLFACKSTLEYLAAKEGFVVCAINYRLAPEAAFPAQLHDCKRALVFLKENVHKWGGDPSKICIAGESAGGHLTALMALTANEPSYDPPEFTGQEDSSMCCAIDIYGVHDLIDELGHHKTNENFPIVGKKAQLVNLLENVVFQKPVKHHMEDFKSASPYHILEKKLQDLAKDFSESPTIQRELCPIMLVHGNRDKLAPFDESEAFFARLQEIRKACPPTNSGAKDVFVAIPGGRHAFGYMPSPRAVSLAHGMAAFMNHHTTNIRARL